MTSDELIIKITEHDQRLDYHENRLDKLEEGQKKIDSLTSSFSNLDATVKILTSTIDNLNARMLKTEVAPAEKYEKIKLIIVTAFITAIVSGTVALFFNYV